MSKAFIFNKLFVVFFFFSTVFSTHAQIDPGIDFDLQGFIDSEISAGRSTIVIPEGRHRVTPPGNSNQHLYLKNLNDITIIADNAEMICTETVQGIRIEDCNNLTIQGLKIDYDPLPFTQGEIISISGDKTKITVNIIDGYSTNLDLGDSKVEIYDANTEELASATYYGATYQVNVNTGRVVITKPTRSFDNLLKLGDIVVLGALGTRKIPHTVLSLRCNNLNFQNVTAYASTSFSFLEVDCNNSSYVDCSVDRRPLETDVQPRTVKRMRSGNADAFHSKNAEIGPSYVGCIARYNGDDSYAINGSFHIISETNGEVLTVIVKGGGNNVPNLEVGETVEMISYSGERIPDAIITDIVEGRPLNQTEIDFLSSRTSFRGSAADTHTASKVYNITINRSVNLSLGSLINSASRVGNGFEVRNCISGPNRSRGILVKSSHGIITGNTCTGNWLQAIKCSPEYNWLEAGSGNDIEISTNMISGCRNKAISIEAIAGDGSIPQAGAHNDIRVFNNQITNQLGAEAIKITSTTNLCFENNTYNVGDSEVSFINVEQISCTLGLSSEVDKSTLTVYPNPFKNHLNIALSTNELTTAKLFDMLGREKLNMNLSKNETLLDLTELETGVYLLKISSNNGHVYLKKIVKQ